MQHGYTSKNLLFSNVVMLMSFIGNDVGAMGSIQGTHFWSVSAHAWGICFRRSPFVQRDISLLLFNTTHKNPGPSAFQSSTKGM